MHGVILCGLVVIVFFVLPVRTYASEIVINEIFANPEDEKEEFIELYNKSESEVDLSGWKISDLAKDYIIIDLKISGNGFLVLEKGLTGIALNNSDEDVSLTDQSDNIVDSYSYKDTIENKSWSRVPDGEGEFFDNTDMSKGASNFSAPTLTPTASPTPTKTPKPTKAPTATRSPTGTRDVKVPTERPYDKEDGVLLQDTKETHIDIISTPRNQVVAGVHDEEEKERVDTEKVNKSTPTYLYSITTGVGMLMLACAIILYRRFKAKNDEEDF